MKKTHQFFVIMALALSISQPAEYLAQKNQKRQTTPVTSTILDIRADNTAYRLHSDSPLSGSSVYRNGVDSVISHFQETPEWELDARSSPTRKMFIDLSDAVPGTIVESPPFTSNYVAGRLESKCYLLYGAGTAVGNMTGLGSTRPCPLIFNLDDLNKSIRYRINMNSGWEPGTDDALFTCANVVDFNNPSSQCNQWNVEPNGLDFVTGQRRSIARLVKVTVLSGGRTNETPIGDYYITFRLGITNP
jgi:hypothetical protein